MAATVELKDISSDDVWSWLAGGWSDMKRASPYSYAVGLAFVLIGLGLTYGLYRIGWWPMIPMAAGGFALLAPLFAVGLYELSRRLETGEPLSWDAAFFARTAAPGQVAMVGFVLLAIFLIWARAAQLIYALATVDDYTPFNEFLGSILTTPNGLAMLFVGTLVGAALAFAAFAVSAVSLPLVMRRDVDAVTAIATSVQVVRKHPGPMLLWAWLIAVITAFGVATAFVGLVFAFPLLGHATWRAYRGIVVKAAT